MENVKILNIRKPLGLSPLDVIKSLRTRNQSLKSIPITYAGRLDPMAEGVLILLAREATHEKEKYLNLDKEYEAEILFGLETDTYDILGMPLGNSHQGLSLTPKEIGVVVINLKGEISLPLPPYSSFKIEGKPLFLWARQNKLDQIKIPERVTQIYDIEHLCVREIKAVKLLKEINEKINLVKGDFRQKEILEKWQEILNALPDKKFLVIKIKIFCSSGTYIRSISHSLGKRFGTGAILLNLIRTKVGEFELKDSIRL